MKTPVVISLDSSLVFLWSQALCDVDAHTPGRKHSYRLVKTGGRSNLDIAKTLTMYRDAN